MRFQTSVSALLCVSLAGLPLGQAQQTPSRTPPPSTLKIVVLQGEGGKHNVNSKMATQTVVEVRDENNGTVPNVRVVFQLPTSGPGGSFPGGRNAFTTVTNFQGQAATSGFVPNDSQGPFQVKVSASLRERAATAVVQQVNVTKDDPPVARKSRKGLWILLAAGAAAGATAGVLLATKGGAAGPAAPPPVIAVPGTVTVGGPR